MTQPGMAAAPKKSILPVLAISCFVVGAVLTAFFVWRIVVTAPSSPQPIEGGTVHLKKDGLTIYASVPVLTPPCTVKDASGNDVPTKKPGGSETITINGDTWYVVAKSTATVPAGDYSISCTDSETSATYAAGPKSSLGAFVLSIFATVFSLLIFIGLGVTFLAIGLVRKNRSRRGANTFPAQPGAPGNYPPSNYPPGNYPQQPMPPQQANTFPPPPPYNPGQNPDRPQGQ
ncbi:hypothetical protein [Kribbella sp.]|uniref:hypothetical protein n=1 Tax=Kribbella sp. TaxID=1871183 RepID=UPI002D5D4F8A|nr:hypothetical protein [Kribbella sp.]HZX04571.1 hypothetical protein [Kribbella sp.]